MPYKLTLVDDQGVVLYTWQIGGDDGCPLPVRAMGAADIIATINREIADIWEDLTGKKTVSETDLSNLESLIRIIVELPRENKWHCGYCNSGYSQFEEYVQHKMRHGYTRDQVGESSDD